MIQVGALAASMPLMIAAMRQRTRMLCRIGWGVFVTSPANDSLAVFVRAMESRESPSLDWVVRYGAGLRDPLWRAYELTTDRRAIYDLFRYIGWWGMANMSIQVQCDLLDAWRFQIPPNEETYCGAVRAAIPYPPTLAEYLTIKMQYDRQYDAQPT